MATRADGRFALTLQNPERAENGITKGSKIADHRTVSVRCKIPWILIPALVRANIGVIFNINFISMLLMLMSAVAVNAVTLSEQGHVRHAPWY
jgi:hypothetical protein